MSKWIIVVALTNSACHSGTWSQSATTQPVAQSVTTRWIRAKSAAETALLDAPARVLGSPQSAATVSPPMLARVVRVHVRPGQKVAADEALLDVLMPDLLTAAGRLASAQIKVEAYQKRKTQLDSLRQEGLARTSELAEVEAQLSTARADGQAARATIRSAGLSDAQATGLLAGSGVIALRAPIAGIVTSADVLQGEVREPSGKPFAVIAGEGEGRVEARLQAPLVDGARFVFVGSKEPIALTLVSSSPRVEPSDGSRLAWFSAKSGALDIGQSGRVRMLGNVTWQVIPARALRPDSKVLMRRGDEGVLTAVSVLTASGAEAVVEGLPAGAEVAADAGVSQ